MSRRLAAIATLLLLGAVTFGCGSNGDEEQPGTTAGADPVEAGKAEAEKASQIKSHIDASDVVRAFPPAIVKDADVRSEKEGTPARALLEWWQAFQFGDVKAVEALTSRATLAAIDADELAELIRATGLQGIEVLGASVDGKNASVRAGLLTFTPSEPGGKPPRKPTASRPAVFAMTKEGGEWVFDETEYLQLKVDARNR